MVLYIRIPIPIFLSPPNFNSDLISMASSSSSAVKASTSGEACIYDVFLSFRGEDTRHSFTDHLYHALKRAGIYTFRDDEEINRGEELGPEIEKAIEASRASIIVLSETYSASTWCLDELLLILKQRRECNHFVLPVFYHVDPTDVRKQRGSFTIEVKPSSKWTDDKVNQWKNALTEISNLSGFTYVSGPETSILKEIVDTIYNNLDHIKVHLPLNITGMETRYKEIKSWFDKCNLQFLAIYGMGGSGKTTLAKYIFNLNSRAFEYASFVEDIGTRCKGPNDLLQVQEQLLKDVLGGKRRKLHGVFQRTGMIEKALRMNRTLIVLDDIVEYSQLVALIGSGKINAQSKIIVTMRENTENWFEMSNWKCQKYEMRLLNEDESLELLSLHAFKSKIPNLGYDWLALEAIQLCEGNPLALEVLGTSLLNNDTIPYWESLLSLFGKDINTRIQCVLMRSYMTLPYDTVRELFLHVACFFTGIDMDYVVKILEPDYLATSGIKTLINRCLLSVSPNKKLVMHRLLQEMGKNIVCQESPKFPLKRSRVWLNSDSYKILRKGMGSETVEGLALDMKLLQKDDFKFTPSDLKTDALKNMDRLKLLQLNYLELDGTYENFSEDLKWLCWLGFPLRIIPCNLYMGNLVAIDMSYSKLEVFEPPTVLKSLQILNLKDSHKLVEIRNILNIPNIETLILWNCYSLVNVCENLGEISSLSLLNMTGCRELFRKLDKPVVFISDSVVTKPPTFSFPCSLNRLFLNYCNLKFSHSFPLSFSVQPYLQYLNLSYNQFVSLPCYHHLKNLRVLDLTHCERLESLCLPNTLAELYVHDCTSLVKITFQSPRFSLQEFGYFRCFRLNEVEGLFKLIPIHELDETYLGHMKWLHEHQYLSVRLVGDDELTNGRSRRIQMLYEFNIMSTSLPNIEDPNMTPEYISDSNYLSFDVPSCPKNKRLKGIILILKYALSGDDWVWFCKIGTTNGVVDLMYNPRVFGQTRNGEAGIWLSYWPIGNTLDVGDTVSVSIVVLSGLEVHECGVSLVYSGQETLENNLGWEETLGGDLGRYELSTGAYYLCRRDFFELMEVGRLTPDWFRILFGDTIDHSEVRGWRKTGRPKQVNDPSFTELEMVRCIIDGPQCEDTYKIIEMSKSSMDDTTLTSRWPTTEWMRFYYVSNSGHTSRSTARYPDLRSLSSGREPTTLSSRRNSIPFSQTRSPQVSNSGLASTSTARYSQAASLSSMNIGAPRSSSIPMTPPSFLPIHSSMQPSFPYQPMPHLINTPTEDEEHKGVLEKIKSACSLM